MIIFMGVAGAGKSVQGKMLADSLSCEWISTGELLRNNLSGDRKKEMLEGKLLDDKEIIGVIENYFVDKANLEECILDGFPRTIVQAEWLLQKTGSHVYEIHSVVHLKASERTVKKRLIERGRPDDNEQAIATRFEEYKRFTLPIISRFNSANIEIHEIEAEGSIEEIHQEILKKVL